MRFITSVVVFLYLCGAFFSTTLFAESKESKRIKLVADRWYPFNGDPWGAKPGYVIELAKIIFEQAEYKIDYQIIPWERAVTETGYGKFDGIVGASVGDAPNFIYPQNPVGIVQYTFFTNNDYSWRFTDVNSLKGRRLGYIKDYSYGETVDSYIEQNSSDPHLVEESGYSPLAGNIHKLRLKQIDIIVSAPQVFYAELEKMKLSESLFTAAGMVPERDKIYIAFSPENPERSQKLAQILSDGVAALRTSGELGKILAKYGLRDWE